jgi:low temperature requirement protein LtrA
VLGETIVAVTVGLGHVEWQWSTTIAGVAGLAIATGLWWIHFDNVDGKVVRRKGGGRAWQPTVWIYSHLPLAIGIAMIGVGVEHAIVASDHQHHYTSPERWLLVGGVVLALAAMVGIEVASKRDIRDDLRKSVILSRFVVIVLALLVGIAGGLEAPGTVVVLAALCGALVVTDLVIATIADN